MIRFSFIFKGNQYLVTEFKKNDISEKYLSWLNDKKNLNFSRHKHIKYTKKKCLQFFFELKKNKNLFLAIFCISQKKKIHIGTSIILIDKINKSGEMSILIGDKNFLKIGLATYVWGKIIKFIFHKLKLRIIISGTVSSNQAMKKIFKKNKMKLYRTPKRFFLNKKEIDGIYAYIKNKNF